jgi:beta-mannosidase
MKLSHDLSTLPWLVAGFNPYSWRLSNAHDIRTAPADFPAVPVDIPGSVQAALLRAGVLPDWNQGMNSLQCEWVENRHWVFQTDVPDEWTAVVQQSCLKCLGLDDRGWVFVNGNEVARFEGAFTPHTFDLGSHLKPTGNRLQIIFDLPPRWLGQIGYTSRMTEWKARYNYSWDWISRLVQIGISGGVFLDVSDGVEFDNVTCMTEVASPHGGGRLRVNGTAHGPQDCRVDVTLTGPAEFARREILTLEEFNQRGLAWEDLPVQVWWPNGHGPQPLYQLVCRLQDSAGRRHDEQSRTLGFKHVAWLPCEGAPAAADPWVCAVNGKPIFLQGVNWSPIRPTYADLREADYRRLLELYRDLGCNILRVWGGAFPEHECFYRLCDEMGFLLWQEFPLSSSGLENWPPEDAASIRALSTVAHAYIARMRHHVSLLMWCGGNELQGSLDGRKTGTGKPVGLSHPLIARFAEIVAAEDPGRRFVATSSSGPRFGASLAEVGLGVHWDVHGPWKLDGTLEQWKDYWSRVDALFHSEFGAPGASSVEIIRKYSGGLPPFPGSADNPLWRRTPWWIEWPDYLREMGREPRSLEELVTWSQQRQAEALAFVVGTLKSKFPRCGGAILWMGHDSFPCTANTAIIDFDGHLKPSALALKAVWRRTS